MITKSGWNTQPWPLAIAQCPSEDALTLLQKTLDHGALGQQQKHLIKAIALHRSKTALDYLLLQLEQSGLQQATTIVIALNHYRNNSEIRETVANKVKQYNKPQLEQTFHEYWD